MKRILLCVGGVLLALVLSAGAARAFGLNDVIRMHRDGVADSLIVLKIEHSGARFHLEASDLHKLQGAGVAPAVVGAMLATEDRSQAANVPGPDYYPVYPYYYPYGPPFYPRVVVGFDFYAHPRYFPHGPHFGPRPFPIVGPRYKVGFSGPVRRG